MTTKLTSFILIFFFSISSFSQQIGDGFAPIITDFTIPLPSGIFNAITPVGSIPDTGSPSFGWQHLLIIRHPNPNNNNQLQIASSFNVNDRLFFRKLAGGLEPNNPAWVELATRGANNFIGNQSITGNVGIGTTNPKSKLEITDWTTALTIGSTKNTEAMVDNETLGAINFYKHYNIGYAAAIKLLQAGDGNQYSPAHLAFYTTSGGNVYTTAPDERMRITSLGNVGIGSKKPDEKLTVKGKIHAEEVKVDLAVPADYVFEKYYLGESSLKPDYTLLTLSEVEKFTEANHHLPNVPSAKEIKENGLLLGEMSNVLLQKIEELTLYSIEQQKKINLQSKEIELQSKEMELQSKQIDTLKKENASFETLSKRLSKIENQLIKQN